VRKLIAAILFVAVVSANAGAQLQLSEDQKIEHLIRFIRSLKGTTFIRNGSEHSPTAAADHLQMKREKAGSRIQTAKDFIDKIASKSSISGEYYLIRFSNGKEFPAQMVLMNELKKMEEGKK
jgi:hypothetical protein